jgi:hypothetical protein
MLLTESAHLSNAYLFWKPCDSVPKDICIAISFSLMVEVINMKASKKKNKIVFRHKKLRGFFLYLK